MLESVRPAAEDTLPDRILFRLDSRQYDAFISLVDAPPKPNVRLKGLLTAPEPWDPE